MTHSPDAPGNPGPAPDHAPDRAPDRAPGQSPADRAQSGAQSADPSPRAGSAPPGAESPCPDPARPDSTAPGPGPARAPAGLASPVLAPAPSLTDSPEPGLRRVLAPNPSPMTERGTNTWLLGHGQVAVIDPGPADPRHMAAILAALRPGERISHIFVTHAHKDHSPLARPLAQATGAPVLAFGTARDGLSPRMAGLPAQDGGEGLDLLFAPDIRLTPGDRIAEGDWLLEPIHTPGHLGSHLCFAWGDRLFSGDHVMGWAPSLVSPPEGDMTDYMESLAALARRPWRAAFCGHGAVCENPAARIAELLAHRRAREAQILAALGAGGSTLPELTAMVYAGLAPQMLGAAARNLLAHLVDLVHRNQVESDAPPSPRARFRLTAD